MTLCERQDFDASVEHWGPLSPGVKAARTRINQEHDDPLIVAIKAGKQRFTAFKEANGPTWIVYLSYPKEGEKRDKTGDRVVASTVIARADYFKRVEEGTYFERSAGA